MNLRSSGILSLNYVIELLVRVSARGKARVRVRFRVTVRARVRVMVGFTILFL